MTCPSFQKTVFELLCPLFCNDFGKGVFASQKEGCKWVLLLVMLKNTATSLWSLARCGLEATKIERKLVRFWLMEHRLWAVYIPSLFWIFVSLQRKVMSSTYIVSNIVIYRCSIHSFMRNFSMDNLSWFGGIEHTSLQKTRAGIQSSKTPLRAL